MISNRHSQRVKRFRFRVKNRLGCSDRLIPLLAPHSHWKNAAVDQTTELCIEGFPRSANTYAVAAFQLAQNRPVRLAHHSHLPGQVKRALRLGVPVLLLVREPLPAIASLLVRESFVTPRMAVHYYQLFHRQLLPRAAECTVADFDEVIHGYRDVIQRLNRERDCRFRLWESTPENEAACRERIDEMDRRDRGDSEISDRHVARPSQQRNRQKQAWIERLSSGEFAEPLADCRRMYNRILGTRAK